MEERKIESLLDAVIVISMVDKFDPGLAYIANQISRCNVPDRKDVIMRVTKTGYPAIGINEQRVLKSKKPYSSLAFIGLVQYMIGTFAAGCLSVKMMEDVRSYVLKKYGKTWGTIVYEMTFHICGMFYVTYPVELSKYRNVFNREKFGVKRWDSMDQVRKRVEYYLELFFKDNPGARNMDRDNEQSQEEFEKFLKEFISIFYIGGEEDGQPHVFELDHDDQDSEVYHLNPDEIDISAEPMEHMAADNHLAGIIKNAISNCKSAGGHNSEAYDFYIKGERVKPVLPWEQKLKASSASAMGQVRRITKRRPSRRGPMGFGRTFDNGTNGLLIIDTSGSMLTPNELKGIESQAVYLAGKCANFWVMHVDTAVRKLCKFRRGDKLQEYKGAGGTTLIAALNYIDENRLCYDMIVFFTDGYDYGRNIHKRRPLVHNDAKFIWLLTPNSIDIVDFEEYVGTGSEIIKIHKWVEED